MFKALFSKKDTNDGDRDGARSVPTDVASALEAFRFFELEGKTGERGDRFLMPWIYCSLFGTGRQGGGERKRALRELRKFFNQKEMKRLATLAGDRWNDCLREQLYDSAHKYITLCRDDPDYGKKLFGLLRMKKDEVDRKLFQSVYNDMISLLFRIADFPERELMIESLDLAFLTIYPEKREAVNDWIAHLPDERYRAVFRRPFADSSDDAPH